MALTSLRTLLIVILLLTSQLSPALTPGSRAIAMPLTAEGQPGTWALTGAMSVPRAAHSLTLLPNGLVLAAGGIDAQGHPLNSAELYNPATGLWVATNPMSTARAGHSAMLLGNGKVLVAGGFDVVGSSIATAELYDPATKNWTATGSLTTARHEHGTLLMADGKVLVVGGWPRFTQNPFSSAEVYNPTTGTWSNVDSLTDARSHLAVALMADGKVMATGGLRCCPYTTMASVEIFDPTTDEWTFTTPISIPRSSHSLVKLSSGLILAAGGRSDTCCSWDANSGDTAELFNPLTNSWSPTDGLAIPRTYHETVVLPNGNVLVVGGENSSEGALKSAEIYDVVSGKWSSTGSMNVIRSSFHRAVLLPNGQVLVAGGRNYPTEISLASAELYEPANLPHSVKGNLLTNAGFELDLNNDTRPDDWTSNPVVTRSQTTVHGGLYAMKHSNELDSTYVVQQTIDNLEPGAAYALSGWLNVPPLTDGNGFSLTLQVEWRDEMGTITGTTALAPISESTSGWVYQEGVVSVPDGAATATVQIVANSCRGMHYVDDLYFGNALSNGGFEQDSELDGRADQWQPAEQAQLTETEVHSGNYALHLLGSNNATFSLESAPVLLGVADNFYRVNAAVKIPPVADEFRLDLIVEWRNAQGSHTGTTLVKRITAPTGSEWLAISETIRVPEGVNEAVVQLVAISLSGSVYVDDVAVYPYAPTMQTGYLPLIDK